MNEKIKAITAVILAVAVIILPIAILISLAVAIPAQYSNTFVGALDDKYDRLTSIDVPKIVVVGGSSVAFGQDSALLEKWTGMPVVNFGLYAALGTKLMLDLSLDGINEGDVVVLAPELDAQTFSLYFNSETTLRAMDGRLSLMNSVPMNNKMSMLGGMWRFVAEKIKHAKEGTAPNPEGAYNSANFNEYGDVVYPRYENVMKGYYDKNKPVVLDESIVDEEFLDYLNDYIKKCERRGATVLFSFCPVNELALDDTSDVFTRADFADFLDDNLDCKIISDIERYIMDGGYFYDTNFHLNDVGVKYRTILLAEDINMELGNTALIDEEKPEPPKLANMQIIVDGFDENEKYFIYEETEEGNLCIVGVSELGLGAEELTLPVCVQVADGNKGIAVTAIGEGAFAGAGVKCVTIPENSYIGIIKNGAFEGSELHRLNIYIKDSMAISPPANFSGTASDFAVYTPKSSDYSVSYYWSQIKSLTIYEVLE